MRTFNDITTDMRVLAKEIGGGHVDHKEAEKRLRGLADELSNKSYLFADKMYNLHKELGYSEEYLRDAKRTLMRKAVKTDRDDEE